MLIPNAITDNKKDEQRRFWIRVFSSEFVIILIQIEIVQMPETLETSVEGSWNIDSAGGPRKLNKKDNPSWCKNP